MKRVLTLFLSALLLVGALSGCAATPKEPDKENNENHVDKEPPAMNFSRKEESPDPVFSLRASGYSWSWKNADGTGGGVIADAIHPLDSGILSAAEHTEEPFDVTYVITFDRENVSLSFDRWDYADIGNPTAPVKETDNLTAPFLLKVKKSSVYVFHARFADSDQGSGTADYYLVTGPDAVIPEVKPVMDAAAFMMSDDYSQWWSVYRQAMDASRKCQKDMDGYYAKILPLLLADDGENAVCSPLNVYLAMSMLAETTGGETCRQILNALGARDLPSLRHSSTALREANDWDVPVFQSLPANSLWLSERFPVRREAVDALESEHKASVFTGVPGSEEFDRALQEWTDEHTGGLLEEYTKGMYMDPRTVLELVSTLYFKAPWITPFSPGKTVDAVFHGVQGDAPCRMMRRSESGSYYYGEDFAAVELGLSECGYMTFVLPDEGTAPEDLLENDRVLSLIRGNYEATDSKYLIIDLGIPQFDVKEKTELRDILCQLGITDAFDAEAADFSPLTAEPGVFLSKAEHAAAVKIDEEGVTGAAYTELGLCGAGMPPEERVELIFDRPFLFAVTGRDGSILFAGVIRNIDE